MLHFIHFFLPLLTFLRTPTVNIILIINTDEYTICALDEFPKGVFREAFVAFTGKSQSPELNERGVRVRMIVAHRIHNYL